MTMPSSHTAIVNTVDRLRREGQQPDFSGRDGEASVKNLIVIGASAGGHTALKEVLKAVPDDTPAAVIIAQHLAAEASSGFHLPAWLSESTRIPVVPIRSGERLRSGAIYTVPPGMSVSLQGRMFKLSPLPLGAGPVATINTLFTSAAQEFGERVIGVILTGFLRDGTDGLKAVHDAGGLTIVQDPAEAEYPGMPASAMKDIPVTFCLSLAEIGPTLELLARRETALETGLAVSVRTLKERLTLFMRLIVQSERNPATHQFLSTEMVSLESDLGSIQTLLNKVLGQV
jgi:two-component system chemotaxis response regulator CheB